MDSPCDRLQLSLGVAYVVERELTGGGMSRIFLAEETRFRRRMVVKVLSPELAASWQAVDAGRQRIHRVQPRKLVEPGAAQGNTARRMARLRPPPAPKPR